MWSKRFPLRLKKKVGEASPCDPKRVIYEAVRVKQTEKFSGDPRNLDVPEIQIG